MNWYMSTLGFERVFPGQWSGVPIFLRLGSTGIGSRTGATGLAGGIGGANYGATNQFGRAGGLGGGLNNINIYGGGMNGNMGGQNNSTLTKPIHVDYSVGFDYSTPATTRVATDVSAELSHTPYIATVSGPISVQMQGRTAILTGTVRTDHARDLAAQVALLEPGIDQIRNDLQVRSAPSTRPASTSSSSSAGSSSLPELPAPRSSR